MIVYILSYSVLCAMAFAGMRGSKRRKSQLYWLGCGIILTLICFRDVSVGSDTANYCATFLSFRVNTWEWCFQDVSWERGFVALIKLLGYIVSNANGFIIVMGLINIIPIILFLRYSSSDPMMSIILFLAMFFTAAEYLYRQWIAVLILLLSCRYVTERKPIKFLLCVLVASFFHRSALAFAVVYVLYCLKINHWVIALSLAGSVFLALTGDWWLYLANLVARTPLEKTTNQGITMMLFLWICLLIAYFVSRKRLKDPTFKLHFIMLLIAATTQPIAFTFSLWARIVLYFRISLLLLLPQVMRDFIRLFKALTLRDFINKAERAYHRLPLSRIIKISSISLPDRIGSFQLSKLELYLYGIFYALLLVYFCMNGLHDFKFMRFS